MKLTVLGNNGPYPKAGGACSGYLITHNDTKILIDCGNGVLSRLLKVCEIKDIDAILLSHLHSDHISDIFVLKYAIGLNKNNNDNFNKPILLYTATDDKYLVDTMNYNDSFDINAIQNGKKIMINELNIEFKKMCHPVETFAIKISDGKKTFIYSGDTKYTEELINFAADSDFFLCEAGVLEKDMKEDTPHLSPKQAGEIAEKANVKRLVLTHFWPKNRNDEIMEEAKQSYNSILELSKEMKSYYI